MSSEVTSESMISEIHSNRKEQLKPFHKYLKLKHSDFLKKNSDFERRFTKWFPVFLENYSILYEQNSEAEGHLLKIVDRIVEGVKLRPGWLLKKDTEREESDWYQHPHLVGAMLYVDKFAGTFSGVETKVPYLKELGINYLHLMPFYKTIDGFNDGGYAVSDYRETRKDLGSVEDLQKLGRMLDENQIEVVADVVLNHTSDEHLWAQKALEGDQQYQNYFLMFDSEDEVQQYEKYLVDVFPEFAPGSFTYNDALDKWIWTSFYSFQWDLNYKNPELFNAMFSEIQFVANLGAGVLRVDAVPFTWKEKDTSCQNLPEAHTLLRAYRALMRITAPSVVLKSEAIVSPEEIIKYLGTGGYEGYECDLGYNATLMNHMWHALACQNTHLLRTTLSRLPNAPETSAWINYVRCHDDIGWGISDENAAAVGQPGWETRRFCTDFYSGNLEGSFAEGYVFQRDSLSGEARISGTGAALAGLQKALVESDEQGIELSVRRLLLLYSVTYFYKGIPLLYMGEEIGQFNDFSYLNIAYRQKDNRWVHRPDMDWEKAELRKKEGTVENKLFNGLKQLAKIRKQQRALHSAANNKILILPYDSVFAMERETEDSRLLMLTNFSQQDVYIQNHDLPANWQNMSMRELFSDKKQSGIEAIQLPPYGFKWFEPDL